MPGRNMAVIWIPYVNKYADRHGRVRHYFRKRGHKAVPLPGIPGSAEFMAAYQDWGTGSEGRSARPRQRRRADLRLSE